MIVGEAKLRFLQRGVRQQVLLPFERGTHGELRRGPILGAIVSAQAQAFAKGKRCTVVDVQHTETGWLVTLAAGDVRDQARLLAGRKGTSEAKTSTHDEGPRGYVLIDAGGDIDEGEFARAMRDEPEVLDETHERVVARLGSAEQLDRQRRRDALTKLHASIRELEEAHPQDRGYLQRLKAQARRLDAA